MKLKLLFYFIFFILGCLVGGYIAKSIYSSKNEEEIIISHSLIMNKIESIGKLEVVKYNIQDVIEYKKIRQWLPNAKTALLVQGEVIACIDLTQIKEEGINVSGDSIALLLPSPEICHVKINHSQSKIYDTKYGLWESAQLVDEAYKYAQKELELRAKQINLVDEARTNTVHLLTPMFNAMGFNSVTIMFRDDIQKN